MGIVLGLCMAAGAAVAQATADCDGCQDIPLLERYPGSLLVGAEKREFDEVILPAGPIVETPEFTREFPRKQAFQGRVDKLFYHGPVERSALEIYANYQQALAGAGFQTLFACEGDDGCGKNFTLGMTDLAALPGGSTEAAQGVPDAERPRYTLARLPRAEGDVYLALFAADLSVRGHAGVLVTVIETAPMDTGMVTIDAAALAQAMLAEGKVALYGVHFDVDSAVVKPESRDQLDQVAGLLQAEPDLKLYITGHTDSTGDFAHNMQLSGDRAAAVVAALVESYGIDASRLSSAGLGPTSPVASNDSDDGKAKNRRVELVRQ